MTVRSLTNFSFDWIIHQKKKINNNNNTHYIHTAMISLHYSFVVKRRRYIWCRVSSSFRHHLDYFAAAVRSFGHSFRLSTVAKPVPGLVQGVQEKLCFYAIHCNPSLAYIAVRDLESSQRNTSVQSLLLAGNFLYNQ